MNSQRMLEAVGHLCIPAERLPDGRLKIGDEVTNGWPESFIVSGVAFAYTEEEDLRPGIAPGDEGQPHEVQGIYFKA